MSTGALAGEALEQHLAALGAELAAWRALWSEHAFQQPELGWEAEWSDLARSVRALDPGEALQLHRFPARADALLARWLPVARWRELESVPAVAPPSRPLVWPRDAARDVPGRKWRQIESFVNALDPARPARMIDWCAGKGHLARALAVRYAGCEVVALERDAALVDAGAALARRGGLAVRPVLCDVLGAQSPEWIDSTSHVCALHACGHLHLRLFELAALRRPAAISCAPCCHHLAGERGARAFSRSGQRAWPGLGVADLRTAVQETVTAQAHARRRRRHLQQWQLGFDALARELRGVDEYLPLPPVEATVLRGDFAGFCRVLAARKGLELPPSCDFASFESIGRRRFLEVTALDLVRQRFRRLIELWVVADRALYLAEQGYEVRLRRFCARSLSPRDLLIDARRLD